MLARTRLVLSHPFFPENLGSAARAMKNTGLSRLIVADPGPALPDQPQARALAVMAGEILEAARVVSTLDEAIAGCTLVFGTTRRTGETALSPREAAALAARHAAAGGEVALVFGNEKNGLSNEELRRCHQVLSIPTATDHTSLNLAQAVMVVSYEWFLASMEPESEAGEPLTALGLEPEIQALVGEVADALESHGFFKDHNRSRREAVIRRVLSRAILDPGEAVVFRGLAHRLASVLRER